MLLIKLGEIKTFIVIIILGKTKICNVIINIRENKDMQCYN